MKLSGISSVILIAVIFGVMLSACTSPPDEEIMAAEDAIKRAVAAGADEDSPRLLDKARTLLQEAKMLNEQGDFKEARDKASYSVIQAKKAEKNSTRIARASEEGADMYDESGEE